MPKFSDYFSLNETQFGLDFVDINTERDLPLYLDPFAIEIRDDPWAGEASEYIRTFFQEVLKALRAGDENRAKNLMSHLHEPKETFLGISKGIPKGRGVGQVQAAQLINSIKESPAFSSGLLTDLSEMALYVKNVNRDKISDLTTNIIRKPLVDYTLRQCNNYGIETKPYNGPSLWDKTRLAWVSDHVNLPYIGEAPVLLIPKYWVRRRLSLEGDEFYRKEITDFLVRENYRAHSSLVHILKNKKPKVYKSEVRAANPYSKNLIADLVSQNPFLLDAYKEIAKNFSLPANFEKGEGLTVHDVCRALIEEIQAIVPGRAEAERYHRAIMAALTVLFWPNLTNPGKEWPINDGRKRIDLVYTNAAEKGFFAQKRDWNHTQSTMVIVECKNYSDDIANNELDQLLGRFDNNRGFFGILTCRSVEDKGRLDRRLGDMAKGQQAYILVLTDGDILEMLKAKMEAEDEKIEAILHAKFRELLH